MNNSDVIILGAGAAGLMCAIEAGKRGRKVRVLDHGKRPGMKILMSGGGRCNFTNYSVSAENYLSHNPHFCKSALKRFSQWDFLAMIDRYQIPYHERLHGQLFCDRSAQDIVDMLLAECRRYAVEIELNCKIQQIQRQADGFVLETSQGRRTGAALVVATGGLSIPKIGASPLGYRIADQFGIKVWPTRAGLVPLTLQPEDAQRFTPLTGIAVPCRIGNQRQSFQENLLFTHRGISGPVVLQMSSYWQAGEALAIDLLPNVDLDAALKRKRQSGCKLKFLNVLSDFLPKRLLSALLSESELEQSMANCADATIETVAQRINHWQLKPNASEGYRTAEVTLGGIDCDALSSKTLEARQVPGLYFIGEVVDVSGWLGGYNLQWAWSSGWCAGQYV